MNSISLQPFSGIRTGTATTPMAAFLGFVGGYIEAIGYILLFNLFIGPMSGNTIVLGVSVSLQSWENVYIRVATLVTFFIGAMIGTLIKDLCLRYHVKRIVSIFFTMKLICVTTFFVVGTFIVDEEEHVATNWVQFILLIPGVLAMALQTGVMLNVNGVNVGSTVVTSTLSNGAVNFMSFVIMKVDLARGLDVDKKKCSKAGYAAMIYLMIWSSYLIGATGGTILFYFIKLYALLLPMGAFSIIIILDILQLDELRGRGNGWTPVPPPSDDEDGRLSEEDSGFDSIRSTPAGISAPPSKASSRPHAPSSGRAPVVSINPVTQGSAPTQPVPDLLSSDFDQPAPQQQNFIGDSSGFDPRQPGGAAHAQ